jgi:hypothetical protein
MAALIAGLARQERQSRRPACFIRTETGLRGARVVYNESNRRLDLDRRGNDRHAGAGRLLLLFCVGGDRRFQRSQELPWCLSEIKSGHIRDAIRR